jgi:hypothetical protein
MPASMLALVLPGWLAEHPFLAILLSMRPTSGPFLALGEYREPQRIAFSGILIHFLRPISTKAYALVER